MRPWSTIATIPAHEGAPRLVPPTVYHDPCEALDGQGPSAGVKYTIVPVLGSPTKAMSGALRWPIVWTDF
jgi:hypothetical protein